MYGAHIEGTLSLGTVASSTATLLAAVGSGTRFHLQKGFVSLLNPGSTAPTVVTLYETTSGGTSSRVLGQYPAASNTPAAFPFDFEHNGDQGLQASDTNSRLAMAVGGSDCSMHAAIVGYKR